MKRPSHRPIGDIMPLDRCKFATSIPLNPECADDSSAILDTPDAEVLRSRMGTTRHRRHKTRTLIIELGPPGGLQLYAEESSADQWQIRSVEINPGNLLNGHNAKALIESDVHLAFQLAVGYLTPLLLVPSDAARIIPGVAADSPSFWTSLEIFFHIRDPQEDLLELFRNIRHHRIQKAPLRCEGESIRLGTKRGGLGFNIYRKDIEVMQKGKAKFFAGPPPPMLRVEVTLRHLMLSAYFERPSCKSTISGKSRLVRFSGADLMKAHRKAVLELTGFACSASGRKVRQLGKFGCFIATLSHKYGLSIEDLLSDYGSTTVVSDGTLSRIRLDATAKFASFNPVLFEELFAESNYRNQPGISSPQLEHRGIYLREVTELDPQFEAAYSSLNPGV